MGRGPASFSQADVVRALKALKQANAEMAVEIATDGTIRLMPVEAITPGKVRPRRREPVPL